MHIHMLNLGHVVEHPDHNLGESLGSCPAPGVHDDVRCVVVVHELPQVNQARGYLLGGRLVAGTGARAQLGPDRRVRPGVSTLPLTFPVELQDLHHFGPRQSDGAGQPGQHDALHVATSIDLRLGIQLKPLAHMCQVLLKRVHGFWGQAPNCGTPNRYLDDGVVLCRTLRAVQQLVVSKLFERRRRLLVIAELLARTLLL
mmetsp:Transcript_25447/g.85112  ORF Transcript_25447/g.85112 Transcript_25447/m.85112 type:complete len:200 (+) Transcript_25447:476-1075(+)